MISIFVNRASPSLLSLSLDECFDCYLRLFNDLSRLPLTVDCFHYIIPFFDDYRTQCISYHIPLYVVFLEIGFLGSSIIPIALLTTNNYDAPTTLPLLIPSCIHMIYVVLPSLQLGTVTLQHTNCPVNKYTHLMDDGIIIIIIRHSRKATGRNCRFCHTSCSNCGNGRRS